MSKMKILTAHIFAHYSKSILPQSASFSHAGTQLNLRPLAAEFVNVHIGNFPVLYFRIGPLSGSTLDKVKDWIGLWHYGHTGIQR